MSLWRLYHGAVCVVLLLASDSAAQSLGSWHLPSTLPQYCGFGCGPGHHAPRIRMHGCAPARMPRCVHTRECLSGGMAPCGFPGATCPNPHCHAALDELLHPQGSMAMPETADQLFSFPNEEHQQLLAKPPVEAEPLTPE